ncbi:DUF6258 family protein [Burkholderia sp. AU45274]|uniref:DUF6258 family protein n=1 Tax=Burkholderia sp. AU45274 TaxID=3059205 RepID=UPI0026570674|nr:DUF6258 family protein [Burkholderia sp. AU45274]MDN7493533.1 DUF6258 family protein [Burkholderia sp. AU45274]
MIENPRDFFKTVYLGDRACKAILIDSWESIVRIQVDLISRIRSECGNWDFYTDEDVENGLLVFTNVKHFSMSPEGLLPNDLINSVSVERADFDGFWTIKLGIDSADERGHSEEVKVKIVAESVYIESEGGLTAVE